MLCDNKITDKNSKCDSKVIINGKWSPIYSQALLVELENGMRFISNFRYNVKESLSQDPLNGDISAF